MTHSLKYKRVKGMEKVDICLNLEIITYICLLSACELDPLSVFFTRALFNLINYEH